MKSNISNSEETADVIQMDWSKKTIKKDCCLDLLLCLVCCIKLMYRAETT